MAPFDGKYQTSYLITVYEIFANQKFYLEIEGQGEEKQELCHSSGNRSFYKNDFFQNCSYLAVYVYAKRYTLTKIHTHTHIDTQTHSKR